MSLSGHSLEDIVKVLGREEIQSLLWHYRKLETQSRLFAADPRGQYCGRQFDRPRQSTIDHVVPVRLGGASDESNMILACGAGTTQKGGKTLAQWADRLRRQLRSVERIASRS